MEHTNAVGADMGYRLIDSNQTGTLTLSTDYDQVVLLQGVSISTSMTLSPGILSTNASRGLDLTIHGSVLTPFSNGIDLSGQGNSIRISNSGSVQGYDAGILIARGDNRIVNEGSVTGVGRAIQIAGSNNEILNTGSLLSSSMSYAVEIGVAESTGHNNLVNAGLISSRGSILAIRSIGGKTTITNTSAGVIEGSIVFDPDSNPAGDLNTVFNFGVISAFQSTVRGAIWGSDAPERIVNHGQILGFLQLGGGDDLYDGRLGFVSMAVTVGAGHDTVLGGVGDETIDGGAGNDQIDGGGGVDTFLVTTSGALTIDLSLVGPQNTGFGLDTLIGIENVTVTSNSNDRITGSDVANALRSGSGNDTLEGGLGNDTLDGGMDNDTVAFTGPNGAVADLRRQGETQNTGYGLDTLIGIENLEGGAGDDRFTGNDGANILSGSSGNDTLVGGLGNDILDGGAGVDTAMFAGAKAQYQIAQNLDGSVKVVGPDGEDVVRDVRFLQFSDGVIALTNAAPVGLAASAVGIAENAPLGSVVATLSAHDADGDVLTYSLTADGPLAIVGNNLVVARALDFETVPQPAATVQARDAYGGSTSQTFVITVENAVETTSFVLQGGAGADTLRGEAGNDTIYGGASRDALSGGAGQDKFVFNTRTGRSNVDTVADFVAGTDSIWLDNAIFKALGKKGSLAKPQKLGSDAFVTGTRAQDAEDRIVYDRKSSKLYYDEDGRGAKAQVQIAALSKGLKMSAGDFFVI